MSSTFNIPNGFAISVSIHALLGQSWYMQHLGFNPIQPATKDFVNASFANHYGSYLNEQSYAWIWAATTVSFNIGAFLGSIFISHRLMERLGRRLTVLVYDRVWYGIGILLEFTSKYANSFEMLMLGRFLVGFGLYSGTVAIFVTESCRDDMRGKGWMYVNLGQYLWVLMSSDAVFAKFDAEAELNKQRKLMPISEIWANRTLRYPMLITFCTGLTQSFSGSQIFGMYSTSIFMSVGLSHTTSVSILTGFLVLKLVMAGVIATFLIERIGRRPLMMTGIAFALMAFVLIFAAHLLNNGGLAVTAYVCGLTGEIIGLKSIPQLLLSELNPQSTRTGVARWYQALTQFGNGLQILGFPPLRAAIGAYAYVPGFCVFILCSVVLWLYLPETRTLPVGDIVKRRRPTKSISEWTSTAKLPPRVRQRLITAPTYSERAPLVENMQTPANRCTKQRAYTFDGDI